MIERIVMYMIKYDIQVELLTLQYSVIRSRIWLIHPAIKQFPYSVCGITDGSVYEWCPFPFSCGSIHTLQIACQMLLIGSIAILV